MMKSLFKSIIPAVFILSLIMTYGCSTTKNLPEGEVLYTGIHKIKVEHEDKTDAGTIALEEVEAAVSYPPNNALFGSSQYRTPFPIGLWAYNAFLGKEKGLGKWLFDHLATNPVLLTTVNPDLRAHIAQNVLHNYGYFNGEVSYQIEQQKGTRKAKVNYIIDMMNPYFIDSVAYMGYPAFADSLIQSTKNTQILKRGNNFSVVDLEAERTRLSDLFRDNGCYNFRPDYITYRADTLQKPGMVSLQVVPQKGIPTNALKRYFIGQTELTILRNERDSITNSVKRRSLTLNYSGKKTPVKLGIIYRNFFFRKGHYYSQDKVNATYEQVSRMGIFSTFDFAFIPRDSTANCDTLDVKAFAVLDKPIDGELELNFKSKSNDQMGPGLALGYTRHNVFRGGETFSAKLTASYEWQTGNTVGDQNKDLLNSYEFGLNTSLTFPRILLPGKVNRRYRFPASTRLKADINQLNRAQLFRLMKMSGGITYDFQKTATSRHSVSPFTLTYSLLQNTTEKFDSITQKNPALYVSLRDQFIPAMSYTYTYDNSSIKELANHKWWQTSVTSSGNILSGINAILGHKWNQKGKKLLWNEYAQFLKLTTELRNTFKTGDKSLIATRVMAGAIVSYGNSNTAPYSEQFFIGGANSLRAFTIRSIGPGSYHPEDGLYTYLDQTGDLKFEANIEYRFNMFGNLYGATFIDTGNVWTLKYDSSRIGSQFKFKRFFKDLALDAGVGLRYDLDFLILRFDVGAALHVPYDTGKKGYYNIPNFRDSLGFHLAVGYPF